MNEKADSDSAKSKVGEEERHVGDLGNKHETDAFNALPDPDAGLSDDERAKIVRYEYIFNTSTTSDHLSRTRNSSVASTSN